MKLNNRGFAISTVIYIILIIALMLIMATLGLLSSRKLTLDKIKNTTLADIKHKLGTDIQYDTYKIGDTINYKNMDWYVIRNSDTSQNYVVLLKTDSLSYTDIASYSLNITDTNGYGYLAYGSSDYNTSIVKTILDAWITDHLDINDLKTIDNYNYRLLDTNDYNLIAPNDLLYSSNFAYFTMIIEQNNITVINNDGTTLQSSPNDSYAIRPVINLLKSAI